MAHFGYFTSPGGKPAAEFEGDYLRMDKQFAQVWRVDPSRQKADTMVAAIHLNKGEYVKELGN